MVLLGDASWIGGLLLGSCRVFLSFEKRNLFGNRGQVWNSHTENITIRHSVFRIPYLSPISRQHLGSGLLSDLTAPGIVLSVRNLINLMMIISDNSATDLLLAKVGAANVNARLKSLGIAGISVDRSCQKLIMDYLGMDYAKYGHLPLDEIRGANADWTAEQRKTAVFSFSADLQDQATPKAMTELLTKIVRKEILDPDSCDLILGIMRNCQTGQGRITAGLPPETPLAHKTGTIAGTVNDCGIIDLPDGRGRLVLTVWTKNFLGETEDVEAIIAEIARFAYDYFYFADSDAGRLNP